MNKKYISLIAVSLIVILLLTTAVSAGFIDGLQYFVTEGYQGREQLLGFFMIFLIFFSVLFGALQKTTFKDQKNASIVIAFCVALISAISIISQIEFSISGFRYVAEGLFLLLLVILIYSLLVKIGMEKHKFLAFILAVLIAAFLIFIVHRLIEEGPRNIFEGLGSDLDFGGVGFGREKTKKSLTPEEKEDLKLQWVEENLVKKSIEKELNKLKGDIKTTTDPEAYRNVRNELRSKRSESKDSTKRIKNIWGDLEDNGVTEEELAGLMPKEATTTKTKGSNIILIVLVIALALGSGAWFVANKMKNQRGSGTPTTEEKLTEEIEKTLNAKTNVTKRIERIQNHMEAIEKEIITAINKFKDKPKEQMDPIFDTDPTTAGFKSMDKEGQLITPLIRDEVSLEKELIELDKTEDDLLSDIQKEWGVLKIIFSKLIPLSNIDIPKIRDNLRKEEADKLIAEIKKLEVLIPEIKKQVKSLYDLAKIEIKEESDLKKLLSTDEGSIRERRFERWSIIKGKEESGLKTHFDGEKKIFRELDAKLKEQINIINGMIDSLREIIKKEKEVAKEEAKAKEEIAAKEKKDGEEAAAEAAKKEAEKAVTTPKVGVKPAEKPEATGHKTEDTSEKSEGYKWLLKSWQNWGINEKQLKKIKDDNSAFEDSRKDASALLEDIKNGRVHRTK